MKKLSLFFAAVMLSAMTFAATFTKVTSAPTDWSGEYVLVYEKSNDTAFVWTGVDAVNGYDTAIISKASITGNFVKVKLEKAASGYNIKIVGGTNDGNYIAHSTNANGLTIGATAAAANISISSGCAMIVNAGGAVMRYNKTSNQMRFRYYKTTSYTNQQPVQLYKLKKQTTNPIPVTGITAVNNQDTVEVGDKLTLNYTIAPDSATDQRVAFAITSGAEFATLNEGALTGVAEGNVVVTVTALDSLNQGDKLSATYNIHVKGVTLNTCAEVNAAAKGDALKLNPVTAVYVNGANIYVKDASGSTLVYINGHSINAGDAISGIKGTVDIYNGLPELKPTSTTGWTITPGAAPAIPEALAAPTAAEVNQVLEWKGVKGMSGEFTTASATNITGKFGTDSIAFYNNFKIAQTFDATHSYDITGAVAIYTKDEVTTIQAYFISAKDNGVIPTSLISTEAKQQVRKAMIGGQMVIIRDGKMFNALGSEL